MVCIEKRHVTAKFYFIVFQNQQTAEKILMNGLTLCHVRKRRSLAAFK